MSDNDLLTTVELAQVFRVSTATIRRLAKDGRIPSVRIGHVLRFHEGSVRKAIGIPQREAKP